MVCLSFFNSFLPLKAALVLVVLVRHNYRACGKALICFFPSEMAGQAGNPVNHPISPHVVIYILLCFYSLHGIVTNIAECYFCCLQIGGAFVQQYFRILHEQPDQVHKFYQDSSIVGRPDSTGTMLYVNTMSVSSCMAIY